MPKSSKKFLLSNSKLNSHGFRMLTSGADLSDFLNNPIMYWMHTYPDSEKPDGLLPIGFWSDIKIEGDNITAIPNFDDLDDFAMKIYQKVEHGTLRACSVGALPLETSESDKVPGQTKPTYIRWQLKEASIVDRGSNSDAVVTLNAQRGLITVLSESSLNGLIEPPVLGAYNQKTLDILNNAISVGKITNEEAEKYMTMISDEVSLKVIVDLINVKPINVKKLEGLYSKEILRKAQLSWDEIKMKEPGGTEPLQRLAPEIYKSKFMERHGRLPQVV
ncbi:MAG: hypothetical protein KKE39_05445 [Bacteroidetes bacterium]|nr:hypothetical protein [Bacteroidota bacterium]MBU1373844.1 hypothetical protein [Bacteroidota bacterium]MBU1483950.1 hypothetical protein [Bacteroidota bacterium]MBU1761150.1 hypothetical protein [Bacteroidota bacterium]MBU2045625.1 hypothetical protein [Bacteroidota bacterium]